MAFAPIDSLLPDRYLFPKALMEKSSRNTASTEREPGR